LQHALNPRTHHTHPHTHPNRPKQSTGAAKTAAGPAFIRGKAGAAVAPAAFPSRGFSVADVDLRVAAANRLIDVDDAGDEAELVDYWSNDNGRVGKIGALGGKIEANEDGELVVVAREAAEGEGAGDLELLMGVTDAELDALVDTLLADDVEDEAELPFLAMRRPGVFAMSVEAAGERGCLGGGARAGDAAGSGVVRVEAGRV